MAKTKAEQIKILETAIRKYRRLYKEGKSSISDAEYDQIEMKLKKLDPTNKLLSKVGAPSSGKVEHDPPMLSSDKVYTVEEVVLWAENNEIVWGFKVDGISIEAVYKNGRLVEASTRGNGLRGENVTAAAMFVKDLPKTLVVNADFKIRGEVYITKSDFESINKKSTEKYDSPRNLAAGTIRLKDASLVADRKLRFMPWDMILAKDISFTKKMEKMKQLGFKPADQGIINPARYDDLFRKITRDRDQYDFEMDGLIFKVNDLATRAEMGFTAHHPRWMLALKFASKQGTTKLKSITWQVGRTGKITPVAEIEDITLSGSTISRATLHNAKFVMDYNISPGDEIELVRSGDVIPKVVGVNKKSNKSAKIPRSCPICGSPTKFDGTFLNCTNKNCGESKLQEILHFIDVVQIEGLGPTTARALWESGAVKKAADLYGLEKRYMISQFGKNGEKIYDNIQAAKILPFNIFLNSLGIKALGKEASKELAQRAKSLSDLTPDFATEVLGDGKIGNDVAAGFRLKPWLPFVAAGVKVQRIVKKVSSQKKSSILSGKKVYVTGTVSGMTKDGVQQYVENLGCEWKGMSKSLDFLVVADNPGGVKVSNAKSWGIKTISWQDFIKMA